MEAILVAARALIELKEADLSVAGKNFCNLATAEQWRVVRGKSVSAPEIKSLQDISSDPHFSDKPHCRQRLYELAKIAKLNQVCSRGEPLDLLIAELESDIRAGINSPSAYAILGACHVVLDHYDLGVYYFGKSNQITSRNNCVTGFMSLSRSIPPLASFELIGNSSDDAELLFLGEETAFKSGPVAVVAGNSLYINRFLENYSRSVAQYGNGAFAGLHVHWVQEQGESSETIKEALLASKSHMPDLNATVEVIGEFDDKKSYFAQARFLIARKLIDHYAAPLMITDLDFQLCSDPSSTVEQLQSFDVSFMQHKKNGAQWAFPWLRSLAGTVWVNNTGPAKKFFRLVEGGFDVCFNPSWFNWGVDQNLLTSALQFCQQNNEIKFVSVSDVVPAGLYNVPVDLKAGVKTAP